MNIGIDGNEANLTSRVGVGQYAYHILKSLHSINTVDQYHIYLKNPPLADMPPENDHWHYHVFGPGKLWTKIALPWHLFTDGRKLDLFYSPSHYSPHFSPFPTIPTIHDLGYLDTPEQFTAKDFHQLSSWTRHSLKQATHIAAVSEFTKNEIVRIYGIDSSKITVAYNGVTPPPKTPAKLDKQVLKKFKIKNSYFLYLGTLKPSKNIPMLIRSFAAYLKTKPQTTSLVIAGKKGWLFDEIFKVVTKEGIKNQVIFTDYITETEKWALYRQATATVLPSLYEGFGIPAIESQSVGTPVIASRILAFSEILKNSALLIDPNNSDDLVAAFKDISQSVFRQKLKNSGTKNYQLYTWENSARSLISAFHTI